MTLTRLSSRQRERLFLELLYEFGEGAWPEAPQVWPTGPEPGGWGGNFAPLTAFGPLFLPHPTRPYFPPLERYGYNKTREIIKGGGFVFPRAT